MKMWRLSVSSFSYSVHSKATGASAMRGGATMRDGTGVRPTASSSLTSRRKALAAAVHLLAPWLVGHVHDELAAAQDVGGRVLEARRPSAG